MCTAMNREPCNSVGIYAMHKHARNTAKCTVLGSRGHEYEDGCLLGCSAVQTGVSLPTF
jgi:hypothetical protein